MRSTRQRIAREADLAVDVVGIEDCLAFRPGPAMWKLVRPLVPGVFGRLDFPSRFEQQHTRASEHQFARGGRPGGPAADHACVVRLGAGQNVHRDILGRARSARAERRSAFGLARGGARIRSGGALGLWPRGGRAHFVRAEDRLQSRLRRDGRAVDGGGLENRCTRKGIGGSNPSPSAMRASARMAGGSGLQARGDAPGLSPAGTNPRIESVLGAHDWSERGSSPAARIPLFGNAVRIGGASSSSVHGA